MLADDDDVSNSMIIPHLCVLDAEALGCHGATTVPPESFLSSSVPGSIVLGGGPAGRYCCFTSISTEMEPRSSASPTSTHGGGQRHQNSTSLCPDIDDRSFCIHKRRRIEQYHYHQLISAATVAGCGYMGADETILDDMCRGSSGVNVERPVPKLVRTVGEAADAVQRQYLWLCRATRSPADIAHRLASDRRVGVYPSLACINAVIRNLCSTSTMAAAAQAVTQPSQAAGTSTSSSSASSQPKPMGLGSAAAASTVAALLDFVDELIVTFPSSYRTNSSVEHANNDDGDERDAAVTTSTVAEDTSSVMISILPAPHALNHINSPTTTTNSILTARDLFAASTAVGSPTATRAPIHISTANLILQQLKAAKHFVAATEFALFYQRTLLGDTTVVTSRNCKGDRNLDPSGLFVSAAMWSDLVDGLEDPSSDVFLHMLPTTSTHTHRDQYFDVAGDMARVQREQQVHLVSQIFEEVCRQRTAQRRAPQLAVVPPTGGPNVNGSNGAIVATFGERRVLRHVECLLQLGSGGGRENIMKALSLADDELFIPFSGSTVSSSGGSPDMQQQLAAAALASTTPAMLVRRVLCQLILAVSGRLCDDDDGGGDDDNGAVRLPLYAMLLPSLCRLLEFSHRRAARLSAHALHVLVTALLQVAKMMPSKTVGGAEQQQHHSVHDIVAVCVSLVLERTETNDENDDENNDTDVDRSASSAASRSNARSHCVAILFKVFCYSLSATSPLGHDGAMRLAQSLETQVFGEEGSHTTDDKQHHALTVMHRVTATLLAFSQSCFPVFDKRNNINAHTNSSSDGSSSSPTLADAKLWSVMCAVVTREWESRHQLSVEDIVDGSSRNNNIDELLLLSVANALQCAATPMSAMTSTTTPLNTNTTTSLTFITASFAPKLQPLATDMRVPIEILLSRSRPVASESLANRSTPAWSALADAAAFCAVMSKAGGIIDATVTKYLPLTTSFYNGDACLSSSSTLREVLTHSNCIALKETYVVVVDASALKYIAASSERRAAFAAMLAKYDATCGARLVIPFHELHELSRPSPAAGLNEEEEQGRQEAVTWLGSLARTGCTWLLLLTRGSCRFFSSAGGQFYVKANYGACEGVIGERF
ncbi:Hypothetical protein, putative [Bodo saltans]|uniref:Uncharacterized protein n=1 Tax=Bodo saltans TaxID=75058 RepID=A0A0S4IMD2_BODSA|nr:Hypothetical protein, putative [Bodo saltans]|eukprot:CUF43438.1 Hypothetical protein, putative [Bodo saltans]